MNRIKLSVMLHTVTGALAVSSSGGRLAAACTASSNGVYYGGGASTATDGAAVCLEVKM